MISKVQDRVRNADFVTAIALGGLKTADPLDPHVAMVEGQGGRDYAPIQVAGIVDRRPALRTAVRGAEDPWLDTPNPAFEGSTPLQVIERGESGRLGE
jgi:hypothetical protein